MVRPAEATPAEALICSRWEAVKGKLADDDWREAFDAMEDLTRRRGQVRHGIWVYSWIDCEWTFHQRKAVPGHRVTASVYPRIYSAYAPGKRRVS
jgi:hypothetical protein